MNTETYRQYEDIVSVTRHRRWALTDVSPPAATLSVLVCLLMVVSSLFVAASAMASEQTSYESISVEDPSTDASQAVTHTRIWDWGSMVSDDGFVDVIVMLPDSSERVDGDAIDSLQGVRHARTFSSSFNGFAASLTPDAISSLSLQVPGVVIYPDLPVQATLTDSVQSIGADQVWSQHDSLGLPVTGEGIVVAVIDTGIDYTHPDLGGGFGPTYKVIGGYDFLNKDSDPMDDNGHGTHVAGIIAADGDIVGVAPSAKLLAYKVLGSDGSGSMSLVISAIDAALDPNGDGLYDDRADIISMSLGGAGDPDDPVCLAVEEAISLGVVVVIAAGNEGPSLGTVASPGLSSGAITVGAVDDYGIVANFSSRGPVDGLIMKPEVTAPGVQIVSTVPYANVRYSSPTGYMSMSGTSMATPHVSGAAALLVQMHPDWTPEMVKSALISGSVDMGESYWVGGAGEIWIPDSIETDLFSTTPLVSYGLAGDPSVTVRVSNEGSSIGLSSGSDDWLSMTADGLQATPVMTALSSISPSYLTIASGGDGSFTLSISGDVSSVPQGYYSGKILLTSGSLSHRIPFGFVVLSKMTVHVFDDGGNEVFDPYGGVLVYSLPDADIAITKRGSLLPAPPATFLLPSGTYAVHALGHQLVYIYSNPYALSTTVQLDPMETLDVNLYMSSSHEMVLDLETEDGQPIFVKDFRMYARHEGARNVSFDLTGSDYSVVGSELFSIPDSLTVHVSDTDAQIGIAVSGFSYTPGMWRFMELNWDHWYEYVSGLSTSFMFEASADLQYLLAWEFDGVDSGTPTSLTWDDGTTTSFVTKYDIPGTILNPWCDWGDHRSMGGDAAFFVRRDTDTSLNSFFSGMTRTTIVQGTFTELYYPRGLFEGFFERQYYSPDYDHVLRAGIVSEIYLPDRNFLTPLEPGTVVEVLGAGPFYPSVHTENTDDTFVMFHPLLRDQSGARVGGKSGPSMSLYRNGALMGMYQLSEYLARPDAVRYVDLFGDGDYVASVKYYPTSQIYDDVLIELGFSLPATDIDPPLMTWMELNQRFIPGDALPLSFGAMDTGSSVMASVSWRSSGTTTWNPLTVAQSSGVFDTSIPTSSSNAAIDIKIELLDTSGNFLRYTAKHASLAEVPVTFELSVEDERVRFSSAPDEVVLIGQLTDAQSGNPLSSIAAVPLELFVGGEKVGFVLDEYMTSTSHTHNGDIRFDWTVDPTMLFTGPNQTIDVEVRFDLGVYSPVSVSFQLRSIFSSSIPPQVNLVSPADGSLIAAGEKIVISVDDDGPVVFEYSVDGAGLEEIASPYEIDTSVWSDGYHSLQVVVTDEDYNEVHATYSFDVDATYPVVSIIAPLDGYEVPRGFTLQAEIFDANLDDVTVSIDGAAAEPFSSPYEIDMTSWAIGIHTVVITATDAVGHASVDSAEFEIVDSTLVLSLISPGDGSFVRSGTPIALYILSVGAITCSWTEGGVQHSLSAPFVIDTTDWAEEEYGVLVNASDDLGAWSEISFSITIDDTYPEIIFVSPDEGSFVTASDSITIRAFDTHFLRMVWSLSGFIGESSLPDVSISLAYFMIEGDFTLELSVEDMAGNVVEDALVYTMDSTAPSISIIGVVSGGAIAPGDAINVSVEDPFLSSVCYSMDSHAAIQTSSSFSIDISPLALGWHELEIVASDSGGHESSMSIAFYVDGKVPEIELISGTTFVDGEEFVVSARATDDFAVSRVVCLYESNEGGFHELQLIPSEGLYTASIESSHLWDGMSVYVVAEDHVGNSAETSEVILISSASAPGTGGSAGGLFGSLTFIALMAAAISIVIIAIAMVSRRKHGVAAASHSTRGRTRLPDRVDRSSAVVHDVAGERTSVHSAEGFGQSQRAGLSLGGERVSVLDALSILPVDPPPAVVRADIEEEPDYLQQLERVLNLALISRSTVVHDEYDRGTPEVDLATPRRLSDEDGPMRISGLKMKKLMEGDH